MGVIYRPPNANVSPFTHNFDEILEKISRQKNLLSAG